MSCRMYLLVVFSVDYYLNNILHFLDDNIEMENHFFALHSNMIGLHSIMMGLHSKSTFHPMTCLGSHFNFTYHHCKVIFLLWCNYILEVHSPMKFPSRHILRLDDCNNISLRWQSIATIEYTKGVGIATHNLLEQ